MVFVLSGGAIIFALLCILVGVFFALGKGKVDDFQEVCSKVAGIFLHDLNLPLAAEVCHKIAAGKWLAVRAAIKQIWAEYGSPDKIDDLIARIIVRAYGKLARSQQHKVDIARVTAAALPGMLDDKETDDIIIKAVLERILGGLLTPELRQELATLAPVLSEYGSIQFSALVMAIAINAEEPAAIRAAVRDLIAILRNKDQLDDELVKRAIKGIPRAVAADARHWATLNDIVQKCKPANSQVAAGGAVAAAA